MVVTSPINGSFPCFFGIDEDNRNYIIKNMIVLMIINDSECNQ